MAHLQAQGLRATSRGGHIAVLDAAVAQLVPPMGETLRPLGRIRRRRHQAEHPSIAHPALSPAEVRADLRAATAIVEMAERVVPELPPYR